MNDLISIIMPAFAVEKHATYFSQAISGIMGQTYTHWELIIACDGGSKQTIDVMLKTISTLNNGKSDNRIKIYKSNGQFGPGVIRNMAIKYATGKYLTFHDTDDYSEPTRFEKLLAKMDGNGIVASNVLVKVLYDSTGHTVREKIYAGQCLDKLINEKKVKSPIHLPSALISADLFKSLGGFEKYKYSSDALLAIKLSYFRELQGISIIPMVNEPLFIWNRHSHSITTLFANAYTLKKCQSAQRKPLKRKFREKLLKGEVKKGDSVKKLKQELGLIDNLTKSGDLIKVK